MLDSFRGSLNVRDFTPARPGEFQMSADAAVVPVNEDWLARARVLIPGEGLAAYIALQPLAAIAKHPDNVKVVLALVFLVVTIAIRWLGTEDPRKGPTWRHPDYAVIAISALSYVFLVYATGNQIFWHRPIDDQQLYGQVAATGLGVIGPLILGVLPKR
jgi:hypothetical protein